MVDATRWTRDAVCALTADRVVFLRDDVCSPRPVPDWLRTAARAVLDEPVDDLLARVHPNDAVGVTHTFLDAVTQPGSLVHAPARLAYPSLDDWGHWDLAWLNLLDHEDVGGVLGVITAIDGDEVAPPTGDDAGVFRSTDWVMLTYGADGATIAKAEGAVTELLGYEPHELVGKMPVHFADERDVASAVTAWSKVRRSGKDGPGTGTSERRWVRKDGTRVWIESSYLTRQHADGRVENLCIAWDISRRRAQHDALERSEAQNRRLAEDFRLLADEVPAAVFRCDAEGYVTFHNARWTELFGGANAPARVQYALHPDDRAELDALLREVGSAASTEAVELEARDRDGYRIVGIRFRAVTDDGADDEGGTRIVGSITDITATVQLRRRAEHDPLTGLLARDALERHLTDLLATRSQGVAVAFLDLDGFKTVNDTFGHEAGDAVLVHVAKRLSAVVRDGDAVGRWGGDEFVAVVVDADESTPAAVAARIEAALRDPVDVGASRWRVSSSIGWATPVAGDDVTAVVQRADAAMFEAKRARRLLR